MGENILWMFCGGINLVPYVISEDLLSKVENYTLVCAGLPDEANCASVI